MSFRGAPRLAAIDTLSCSFFAIITYTTSYAVTSLELKKNLFYTHVKWFILKSPSSCLFSTRRTKTSRDQIQRSTLKFMRSTCGKSIALQVETHCCVHCHVCDQLVSQQNSVLQVKATCCAK